MTKFQILVKNDQTTEYECRKDQDLLGQAIRARVPIIVACRSGGCGICKIKVHEGQYERGICSKKTLPDEDRENNYSLACKTYPRSDMVISIVNKSR
jgi:CDP-4-dehydro-6-deoxyglucose reductase